MTVAELRDMLSAFDGNTIITVMREDFPRDIKTISATQATRFNNHWAEVFYAEAEEEPITDVIIIRG